MNGIEDYKVRKSCRLCNSEALDRCLDLPDTPLANEFVRQESRNIPQDLFPLFISKCRECGHVQLPVVVNPSRLFGGYVYVSGTSKSFVDHLQLYAARSINANNIEQGSLVVEIGSNDGTALQAYAAEGMRVIGVDPAVEIAKAATARGIPTVCSFFNRDLATTISSEHGKASIVLANNVFAHADDLAGIVDGVLEIIEPQAGVFIFEVQYLIDMLRYGYFDMIYHEHLSYHSIGPISRFLSSKGLFIRGVEFISTHGGSIRVTCSTKSATQVEKSRLESQIENESKLLETFTFERLEHILEESQTESKKMLESYGRKIWGYGAPAKLTTLFYGLRLPPAFFSAVIDDSPWKQGLFTPGYHIPVISMEKFLGSCGGSPERLLIFAWNFVDQIRTKFTSLNHELFVPLPKFKKVQ